MKRCFVDTNLFLRYLTNDDPAKADRVETLLGQAAAGELALVSSDLVMAEIVRVLESFYQLAPARIAPLIRGILATPGLEVVNAALVGRALELYESLKIDFIDGHIAAQMERLGIDELYSFDKQHIARLTAITRREP